MTRSQPGDPDRHAGRDAGDRRRRAPAGGDTDRPSRWATARIARRMLGGTYGKVVTVVAGKGNNGADGRVAAAVLARAGAKVTVLDAATTPAVLGPCDLVIDAAYGTGFHGDWAAPDVGRRPGARGRHPERRRRVDGRGERPGDGGAAHGDVRRHQARPAARRRSRAGRRRGDGVDRPRHVGGDRPRRRGRRRRPLAATPPGGQPQVACRGAHRRRERGHDRVGPARRHAAMRAGAGMVGLSVPGAATAATRRARSSAARFRGLGDRGRSIGDGLDRYGALVLGPGLGRDDETVGSIRALGASAPIPLVVDADALAALGTDHGPPHERDRPNHPDAARRGVRPAHRGAARPIGSPPCGRWRRRPVRSCCSKDLSP